MFLFASCKALKRRLNLDLVVGAPKNPNSKGRRDDWWVPPPLATVLYTDSLGRSDKPMSKPGLWYSVEEADLILISAPVIPSTVPELT